VFDSYQASAKVRDFAEVLTNWYVRRSRDRFWEGDKDAFDTLYTVLEAVLRVVAPLLPLTAEEMWRGLTAGRSVHLESWPDASEFPADEQLVLDMDAIREAASVAQALRKSAGLRVRLPLSDLTIAAPNAQSLAAYADLIADELNVKQVSVVQASDEVAGQYGLLKSLTVNARALGPRVGGDVQRIIREAKSGNWSQKGDLVLVDGTELFEGEFEVAMVANQADSDQAVGITSTGFVLLNTVLTPELEAEGAARDAIRHIQQSRKDAGLDVSDRITLTIRCDAGSLAALEAHREFIANETLAVEFVIATASVSGELSIGDSGLIEIELAKN
jgi:isoleucyl-tRNA synthetase